MSERNSLGTSTGGDFGRGVAAAFLDEKAPDRRIDDIGLPSGADLFEGDPVDGGSASFHCSARIALPEVGLADGVAMDRA